MRVLLGMVAAGLMATSAVAQERYDWTGLYLGLHGGYSWADIDYPGAPAHDKGGPPRPSLDGGLVGGQLGYNIQVNRVVFGAEVDYSFSGAEETKRDGNAITQSYDIDSLASVRGRLGLAFGRFLPYATAGYAWGNTSFNQTCPEPSQIASGHCSPTGTGGPFAPYNITKSETVSGLVYGGGLEAAIAPNWTLRGEWLRYDFDAQSYTLGKSPSTGKDLGSKTLEHDVDVVRFGVNYKFSGRDDVVPLK